MESSPAVILLDRLFPGRIVKIFRQVAGTRPGRADRIAYDLKVQLRPRAVALIIHRTAGLDPEAPGRFDSVNICAQE